MCEWYRTREAVGSQGSQDNGPSDLFFLIMPLGGGVTLVNIAKLSATQSSPLVAAR
jgi:hypothetical protein